ncbi:MAG: FAD-dependent monooxygenase [Burkholderiaceae bacterium]
MTRRFDVCIRGHGVVGRALALLLARERLQVALVAPPPAHPTVPDVRAYALNQKSKTLLESLRCWPEPEQATAVTQMQVMGDQGGELNFKADSLHNPSLTWIVDVPALLAQLDEALRYQPQIELFEDAPAAELTVVCEGRASSTRAEFGADFAVTPYPQQAIATRLRCQYPHAQTAHQWFSQNEILAFLPLGGPPGNSVAVVWSVQTERVAQLLNSSPTDFCHALELASHHRLGQLKLDSERVAWPLQKASANRWSGKQEGAAWVLAGDAAHNLHPLAGQGLNLGLADVAELAKLIAQRDYWRSVADEKLLRRYERTRKTDVAAMQIVTDGLQLLFSKEGSGWESMRNLGMKGVEHSPAIKQWMVRQALGI